jgi:hypothetical protein
MTMAIVRPPATPVARSEANTDRHSGPERRSHRTDTRTTLARRLVQWYGVRSSDGRIWITHCAWCKRARTAAGGWDWPPKNVLGDAAVVHTHGICPGCDAQWRDAYHVPARAQD